MIFCMQVNAQLKEGFVKYTMKIEGAEDDLMKSMLGNSAINIYFKNDKQVFLCETPKLRASVLKKIFINEMYINVNEFFSTQRF